MIDIRVAVSVGSSTPAPKPIPLWRHKDDVEVYGSPRSCAPCPAVWPMSDHKVIITRQWQYFIQATNARMTLQAVAAKFGAGLAFCNRKRDDSRRDWLQRKDLDRPDPDFDRVRTCSRSVLTGTPAFSLMAALTESVFLVKNAVMGRIAFTRFRQSFLSLLAQNVLIVTMMDGSKDPPLKPGRAYPQRVEDINPDDYLYHPRTHRHLFFVADITNADGGTVPFPNGAVYDWTGDGMPYTWLPHVARWEVRYSLSKLTLLPDDAPIPGPYHPR